MRIVAASFLAGFLTVLFIGCGASDPTAVGQSSEALSSSDTLLKIPTTKGETPPVPVCPKGEKICKLGGPAGCRDVCVIDTALCVAPPECSYCNVLCVAGDVCCPGPVPGTSVCLPSKDLDDGKCPPLP
jgi:hypothetical protein